MKDLFINTLMSPNVRREGIEKLIDYLTNETDFFTAPASTKFHGAEPGGLLEHSIAVARRMAVFGESCKADIANSKGSPAIVSLLHDVCKANFYKTVLKWRKDENNKWEQYSSWDIEDQLPLGHGEKSAYLVSKYIDLTEEEYAAIRWHMGTYGTTDYSGVQSLNAAMDKYPLLVILHFADQAATHFDKK